VDDVLIGMENHIMDSIYDLLVMDSEAPFDSGSCRENHHRPCEHLEAKREHEDSQEGHAVGTPNGNDPPLFYLYDRGEERKGE
jgi:hypothetical protein